MRDRFGCTASRIPALAKRVATDLGSRCRPRRATGLWSLLWLALAALCLQGCALAPPQVERRPSMTLPAPDDSPVTRLARAAEVPEAHSAFWPLVQGTQALDARIALIRQATRTLDLQYYLLADDGVGRTMLRELRDAASRGVRVRLLLDDLYTLDTEADLVALQTYPNVEVRLFNPFTTGRTHLAGRVLNFVGDFRRLNHRMHNKLFIADSAVAVFGGRNLADEYFARSAQANFVDVDLLATGALVAQLGGIFDTYWNSEQVLPLGALHAPAEPVEALQARFEARVSSPLLTPPAEPADADDMFGEPPLSRVLAGGRKRWITARAQAVADPPAKAGTSDGVAIDFSQTLTAHYIATLKRAQSEIFIFSPYFLPGARGLERLKEARDRGVAVRVVTNALASSDEPLVNVAYRNYREPLLDMGVELFELSSERTGRDASIRKAFRSSQARLHAKMGFVDRRIVLIGSMNVDLRSAYSNTELGVGIDSPELAGLLMNAYQADNFSGVYQVRRGAGGKLEWVGRDENGEEVLNEEPETSLPLRLKLWLQFLFVPEDLL